MKSSNEKSLFVLIGILILSLFLPWVGIDDTPGFIFVLVGWIAIFSGIFLWLIFPLMIVSIILLRDNKYSLVLLFSTISVLVEIHTFSSQWNYINMIDSEQLFGPLGVGFFIWLFLTIAITILCLIKLYKKYLTPLQK